MEDSNSLLPTLAQSAAAIVAIIGGFLVSRLVALSSEREGLRRQLISAKTRLATVTKEYEAAFSYRYANSREKFESWVLEDLVSGEYDLEQLLDNQVPRGSSSEEMGPVLQELEERVSNANRAVRSVLRNSDDSRLTLEDLAERGLSVPESESIIYEHVVDHIATSELPEPPRGPFGLPHISSQLLRASALGPIDPGGTAMRRLDESIREEQALAVERELLEAECQHHEEELARVGRPAGVTSAILILSLYSALGIAAPLIAMTLPASAVPAWMDWALLGAFLTGLGAVLAYMLWYARTLDDPHGE